MMIACLAWGHGAAISHRAAASLWQLPGFERAPIELIVPRSRRRNVGIGIVHRPLRLTDADRTAMYGIPVTSAGRTLLDLASVVRADLLEEALDDALRRRMMNVRELRRRVEAGGNRAGTGSLRRLLDERDESGIVPASVLETRFLRLIRRAGLPMPALQYRVSLPNGRVARLDFAYPQHRVGVETDGYRWHGGKASWERDLHRRNALTTLGWIVLHVTWRDVHEDPESVTRRIGALLAQRAPG